MQIPVLPSIATFVLAFPPQNGQDNSSAELSLLSINQITFFLKVNKSDALFNWFGNSYVIFAFKNY